MSGKHENWRHMPKLSMEQMHEYVDEKLERSAQVLDEVWHLSGSASSAVACYRSQYDYITNVSYEPGHKYMWEELTTWPEHKPQP